MDDLVRNDSTIVRGSSPSRRRWRSFLLLLAILTALTGVLTFLFRDSLARFWNHSDNLGNRFVPAALRDYIPEDSEAVLNVDVRTLRESPVGRRLEPTLQPFLQQGGKRFPWLELVGLNPGTDLDTLRLSFAPSVGSPPLWLAQGRLDPTRMQRGPDKLRETTLESFRVWQYSDPRTKQTTWLAPVDDMLVVSEGRARMLAALNQARAPRAVTVRDETVRALLTRVERQQTAWLVAARPSLEALSRIEDPMFKRILWPLLAQAESVHGGITCAENVQVYLHFRAATAEHAEKLEADLRSLCEAAPGAALLLGRRHREWLPLLRLLGSGTTQRDGNEILLRCQLAGDQLEN